MSCIFCQIISSKIPASKVYEDDRCLAFLDIKPVNPGHVLLIPKEHYPTMVETPDELVAYLFVKAKQLMPAIKQAMQADYVAVSVVGVDVPHFHIHLIPRRFDDGLTAFWPTKTYAAGEMAATAEKIKNSLISKD